MIKKNLHFVSIFFLFFIFSYFSCKNDTDEQTFIPTTTYSITLNANGGTITGQTVYTINVGEYWRIPESSELGLSNAPKYFQGWSTTASSNEITYCDNYRFLPSSNITLYAVWGDIKQEIRTANATKSLQTIIDEITQNNIDSGLLESKTAYTIYIDGELKGETKIEDKANPGTSNATVKIASSITLIGKNGNSDKLSGGQTGTILFINTTAPVTIKDLTLSDGKGFTKISEKHGGAIYIEGNKTTVTLGDNTILTGNSADKGGAVYINQGTLNISSEATIKTNNATDGAAIYNDNGSLAMSKGTISQNTATSNGGAVYNRGTLSITGGTISKNNAVRGGGIYHSSSNATLTGGIIEENAASDNGGGIYVAGGTLENNGVAVSKNKAKNGAGVYNNATFNMKGTSISFNEAQENGAGIFNTGTLLITGGYISNNKATENGGGIYNEGTSANFNNGTIEENTAVNGAGIYNKTDFTIGTHTLQNQTQITVGTVKANTATGKGGGVYNESGKFVLKAATEESSQKLIFGTIKENSATEGKTWYKAGGTVTIKGTAMPGSSSDNEIGQ